MQFTDKEIGQVFDELWREREPFLKRMRLRRLLMGMATGDSDDPQTGAWAPPPYDDSDLIIKTLIGDPVDVCQNYTARVSANEPQLAVVPLTTSKSGGIGKRVDERASEQERLLMSTWEAAKGRRAQRRVSWSQSWGRAGWYFTLPRDASWGLPSRRYFEDLTDEEIDRMRSTGEIVPEADDDGRFRESGESWLQRRQRASQERAVDGRALMTLEAYPPDMVLPRYDRDGTGEHALKYGFVVEEVPASDFAPGTELAKSAARAARSLGKDIEPEDIDKYGLFTNDKNEVVGGITAGGEQHSTNHGDHWTLAKFVTREEIYYYVCTTPGTAGTIVYHDEHGAGEVPLVPVPALVTDSMAPGAEFSSPMESIFALTPIINQLETLLSNVSTWNALGRFYVVAPDGTPIFDENGDLLVKTQDDIMGLDPGQIDVSVGEVRQLVLDASLLESLLRFYSERFDQSKPSPVTEGVAGANQAAWQVKQLLESSGELLEQVVANHADAVQRVMKIWIRWFRMLDEPIFALAAPGNRKSERSVRGLIEFQPSDLVESIRVEQSAQSAQQRTVLRQTGIELLQAGRIDERDFYEHYDLAQDPEDAIVRAWSQRVVDIVMLGNTDQVDPDSVLAHIVQAVRGRLTMELLERSPGFALAEAERMTAATAADLAAQQLASTPAVAEDGNVMEPAGQREPGLGLATTLPGNPMQGAPAGVV